MSDRDNSGWDRGDEPTMPARSVLDSWLVPEPAPDLTDRIMAQLEAHPSDVQPGAAKPSTNRIVVAVASVALAAAAALVLTFVTILGARQDAQSGAAERSEVPAVVAGNNAPAFGPVDRGLVIRTTPRDAAVTIDGSLADGRSPFYVEVEPGQHRVRVDRAGYMPLERVVATDGKSLEIPFELELREVVLVLSTDPPQTEVELVAGDDRSAIGTDGSRFALMRKDGVVYEVEGKAPGYASRRVPLSFTGGQDQVVRLTLVPLADEDPEPRSATSAGGHRTPDLKDPFRRVRPKPPEPKKTKRAKEGQDLEDPFGEKSSTLRLGTPTGVPPADVFLDGRHLGKTPIPSKKVRPGRHTVKFKWPDGREVRRIVDVAAGESTVVRAG